MFRVRSAWPVPLVIDLPVSSPADPRAASPARADSGDAAAALQRSARGANDRLAEEELSIGWKDQSASLTAIRADDPTGYGALPVALSRWSLVRLDQAMKAFFSRAKTRKGRAGLPRTKCSGRIQPRLPPRAALWFWRVIRWCSGTAVWTRCSPSRSPLPSEKSLALSSRSWRSRRGQSRFGVCVPTAAEDTAPRCKRSIRRARR